MDVQSIKKTYMIHGVHTCVIFGIFRYCTRRRHLYEPQNEMYETFVAPQIRNIYPFLTLNRTENEYLV